MATLKDVAQKAGVTVTTVSRVLNNRGYISDKTRQKVMDAMREMNYQPNEMARSLSKKNSNTIGVIVPHIINPYFAQMISCIEAEAERKDYKVLLCNSKQEKSTEEEYIEICRKNRVSGLILCGLPVDAGHFKKIDVPVVAIESGLQDATVSLTCDNKNGGYLAAKTLIEHGRSHLLYMTFEGDKGNIMPGDDRGNGFIEECNRCGIEYQSAQINRASKGKGNNLGKLWDEEDTYMNSHWETYIREALENNPETDGIFVSNDLLAAQVLQVCNDKNIRVPEDISLVSFDDTYLSSLLTPPVSSIHQPIREMAESAVNAIQQYENGKTIPEKIILPVTLVERQSV